MEGKCETYGNTDTAANGNTDTAANSNTNTVANSNTHADCCADPDCYNPTGLELGR